MAAWTDLEKQKLRNLHAQGLTPAEMVAHLPGRSRNSIISRLRDMKLETRSVFLERGMAGHDISPDTDLIIRLRCKPWNWPARSIAQALGKHPKQVSNIIGKYTDGVAA